MKYAWSISCTSLGSTGGSVNSVCDHCEHDAVEDCLTGNGAPLEKLPLLDTDLLPPPALICCLLLPPGCCGFCLTATGESSCPSPMPPSPISNDDEAEVSPATTAAVLWAASIAIMLLLLFISGLSI